MRESGELEPILTRIEGGNRGESLPAGIEDILRRQNGLELGGNGLKKKSRRVTDVTGKHGRSAAHSREFPKLGGKIRARRWKMLTSLLLEKLLQIERSLGHVETTTLRTLLMDAEAEALRVQGEMIQVMQDMERLREQYERCARSALSPVSSRYEQSRDFSPEALAREIVAVPPYAHQAG
jgi:hypothetical protein